MDLLQILNFLKNSKFGLPSPAAARLLVFSITVVVNLLVFKPAAELERCQWDRPNPAVLIDVQKIFSKKIYIYIYLYLFQIFVNFQGSKSLDFDNLLPIPLLFS